MAAVRIHVNIPSSNVARLNQPGGAVYDGMQEVGRKGRDLTVQEITAMQAVDTGKMRQAASWEVRGNARGVTARIGIDIAKTPGTVDYPAIVHEGRGPVTPRRARVLRFRPKGSRVFIYRPRVGPAKAKPYLTRALARLRQIL